MTNPIPQPAVDAAKAALLNEGCLDQEHYPGYRDAVVTIVLEAAIPELLDENQRLSQRVTRLSNLERRNAKQRDEARARLAAVEKLHSKTVWHCGNAQHTNPEVGCPDCAYICAGCGEVWPCLTIKAARGE